MFRKLLTIEVASVASGMKLGVVSGAKSGIKSAAQLGSKLGPKSNLRKCCPLMSSKFDMARESAIAMEKSLPVYDYGSKRDNNMEYLQAKFTDDCLVYSPHFMLYTRDFCSEWKRYFRLNNDVSVHSIEIKQIPGMTEEYNYFKGVTARFTSVEKFLVQMDEKPANMRELMELYDEWCYYNNMIPYPLAAVACKLNGDYWFTNECATRLWE